MNYNNYDNPNGNGNIYENPFGVEPQYDFYDDLVAKDAKRAVSKTMLSMFVFTLAVYAFIFIYDFVLLAIIGEEQYIALNQNVYYSMLIGTLPMYIIGIPIVYLIVKKLPKRQPPLVKPRMSLPHFLMMIPISQALMVVGNIVSIFLSTIFEQLLGGEIDNTTSELISTAPAWFVLLTVVILAPIMEELLFRKILLDRLAPYGSVFAIVISGVAFGIFHNNVYQLFYATLVGCVLGYVALKSGNWLYSVALHMIMNFIGGFIPVLIQDNLDGYSEYMRLYEEMLTSGEPDMTAITELTSKYMVDITVMGIYSLVAYGLVAAGIVLLVIGIRKKWFKMDDSTAVRVPKKRIGGVVFGNVGSILFLILSGILMQIQLLQPVIERWLNQL